MVFTISPARSAKCRSYRLFGLIQKLCAEQWCRLMVVLCRDQCFSFPLWPNEVSDFRLFCLSLLHFPFPCLLNVLRVSHNFSRRPYHNRTALLTLCISQIRTRKKWHCRMSGDQALVDLKLPGRPIRNCKDPKSWRWSGNERILHLPDWQSLQMNLRGSVYRLQTLSNPTSNQKDNHPRMSKIRGIEWPFDSFVGTCRIHETSCTGALWFERLIARSSISASQFSASYNKDLDTVDGNY